MFALEINFIDGGVAPETIYVRRPQALIGSSDYAHVVLEDMRDLNFQIRLVRGLGRRFSCQPISPDGHGTLPENIGGEFEGDTLLDLGPVKVRVTALDFDLLLRDGEPIDRFAMRSLRQASAWPSPYLPALVAGMSPPVIVSFSGEQPIFVGRSKGCAMRLDSADVSSKHARVGFSGDQFWIEDLGSTNGTFVRGQQVSGKTPLLPGEPIVLGREITLFCVTSDTALSEVLTEQEEVERSLAPHVETFPALISLSEVARPARLVLPFGATLKLGRDPASDLWLGAPHVSRKHCEVRLEADGAVIIQDSSTNGTAYDGGLLLRGQKLECRGRPRVLNFGGGVTVAICFNDDQEHQFTKAAGAVAAFGELDGEFEPQDLGAISSSLALGDVAKMLSKRGRRATALRLKTWYGQETAPVRSLLWVTVFLALLVLGVVGGLLLLVLF